MAGKSQERGIEKNRKFKLEAHKATARRFEQQKGENLSALKASKVNLEEGNQNGTCGIFKDAGSFIRPPKGGSTIGLLLEKV